MYKLFSRTSAILLLSVIHACGQSQSTLPWVASRHREVVLSSGCPAAAAIGPSARIAFSSLEEAEQRGFRAATAEECQGRSAASEAPSSPAPTEDPSTAVDAAEAAPSGVPPSELASAPPGRVCNLTRVIDGDTVVCDGGERVRLLLIDTPERSQGPYGRLATVALQALVADGEVILESDVQPRDRYGRTLAYLWLPDGRMVNEEMARSGYAVALTYPPNVKYVERIRSAVEDARAAERGLWATPAFSCTPREHRRGSC